MLAVKFSRAQTQPVPGASGAAAPAAGGQQALLPGAWGSWGATGPGGQAQVWPQAEGWLRIAGAGAGAKPPQKEPPRAPKSAAKRRVRKARSAVLSGAPSAADEGRHGAGGDAWAPAGGGRALPPRGAAASVMSGGSDGSGGSQPQQQQHQAEEAEGLRQDTAARGSDVVALPSTKAGVPSTPAPGAAGGGKRSSAGASDKQPRQRSLKAAKRNARASPGAVALQHEGATHSTHSGASTGSGDSPEAPSRLAGRGASAPGAGEGMALVWGAGGGVSGQAAGPSGLPQQQELQPAAPAGGGPAPRPGRKEVPLPFFLKSGGASGGQRGRTPPPPAGGGATAGAGLAGMARSASMPAPAPADAPPKGIAAAVAAAPQAAATAPVRLGSGDRDGGDAMQGVVRQDAAAGQFGVAGKGIAAATAAGPLGTVDGRPPLVLHPAATAPFVLPDPELTKLFALGDSWLGPEASRNAFGAAWSLSCLEGPSGLGASLLPALLGHSQQQQQQAKQCAETHAGANAGQLLVFVANASLQSLQQPVSLVMETRDSAHLLVNSPRGATSGDDLSLPAHCSLSLFFSYNMLQAPQRRLSSRACCFTSATPRPAMAQQRRPPSQQAPPPLNAHLTRLKLEQRRPAW